MNSPEKINNIPPPYLSEVVRLFEATTNNEDVIGYHGTSIEAIQYVSRYGFLPDSGSYGGELYFVPVNSGSDEGDFGHAKIYARLNGIKQFILQKLPYTPIDLEGFMDIVMDFYDDDAKNVLDEAEQHGVSKEQFYQWILEGETQRQGVILTLSKRVTEIFSIYPGEDKDQKKLIIPQGKVFPIGCLSGLEPQGDYEYEIIKKMQDQVK